MTSILARYVFPQNPYMYLFSWLPYWSASWLNLFLLHLSLHSHCTSMSVRCKMTSTTSSQGSQGEAKSPSSTQRCINLIGEYTQGNITQTEAMWEITEAFRESSTHDDITPEQVETTIASFTMILDQAHSRANAAWWGGTNEQKLSTELQEGANRPNWPEYGRRSESHEVTKCGGSPQMTMGTGRVDETLFAWTTDENSQMFKLTRKLIKITPVTSKSPNTTFSAHEDFQNSQTWSGSKSCRGRQSIWMSSSQGSIWPSPIIKHCKQLETSSSDSGMLSPPSWSGTTESGSSHSMCSNKLCGLSSPIAKTSLMVWRGHLCILLICWHSSSQPGPQPGQIHQEMVGISQ